MCSRVAYKDEDGRIKVSAYKYCSKEAFERYCIKNGLKLKYLFSLNK